MELEKDRAWLFTKEEFMKMAQQHSENKKVQLYMYTEKPTNTKHPNSLEADFENYLIDNRVEELFKR